MIAAALLFSLLYRTAVQKTGVGVGRVETVLTDASESSCLRIATTDPASVAFTAIPEAGSPVYYCLIGAGVFEKMTGYGMELQDFLAVAGSEACSEMTRVRNTAGFNVMNYYTAPSENLTVGAVYYLIAGRKNAESKFTDAECIKIEL